MYRMSLKTRKVIERVNNPTRIVDWYRFNLFDVLTAVSIFRKSENQICVRKWLLFCQDGEQDYVLTTSCWGTRSIYTTDTTWAIISWAEFRGATFVAQFKTTIWQTMDKKKMVGRFDIR